MTSSRLFHSDFHHQDIGSTEMVEHLMADMVLGQ